MDLWTNNNASEHTPLTLPDAIENKQSARPRSPRCLTERAVVALLRSWLLSEYVPAYCHALVASRIFRRCYWIDGLGYTDTRQTTPSPLQTSEILATQLAAEERPIALHSWLLTGRTSRHRTVSTPNIAQQKQTPALSLPKQSGLLQTSWLEAAPTLLQALEQSPAIFLLNPLAPQFFTNNDLQALYQRSVPSEYCFVLHHKQIEQCLHQASKHTEIATILTALLRTDRWKTLVPNDKKTVTSFIKLYLKAMQRHFKWSPQQITLTIQSGPASVSDLPTTLIFATRRPESLLMMNDALCRYQRRTQRETYRGILSEEWFVQQEQERHTHALQQLTEYIQQQGTLTRSRRWPDLRQQCILNSFGKFTQDEYDACIRDLLTQQKVRCLWRQAPKSEQEIRIPGNNDTLFWQ
jgi:hypothetical protein